MATYSEIQTRVTRRVIDLPAAVTAEVPALVNEAIRKLERMHNFRVMRATVDFTTTEGTRSVGTLPLNWKEWRDEPYYTEDLGRIRELGVAESANEVKLAFGVDEIDDGEPEVILISDPSDEAGAMTVHVYPLPDGNSDYSDGEYRLTLPYWKFLADLSGSGDTNWFTVNADDYIYRQATADAFALNWDREKSDWWQERADAKANEVILTAKKQATAGTDVLVMHKGARGPHLIR